MQWPKLADWVGWWVEQFDLGERIDPPCWYQHPRLTEELTALAGAWELLYDPASPGTGPITWLREAELCTARLERHTKNLGCNAREHRPESPPAWPRDADWHASFEEYVEIDVSEREAAAEQEAIAALSAPVARALP
ncbi:MAG: hypothetical protein J0H73_07650 [Salana multivorans]|nr:hypothetical protein [Salana multivorans]